MNWRLGTLRNPSSALLCCCAVAAALVSFEWVHFGTINMDAPAIEAPAGAASADATQVERFVPPPAEQFAEIDERPLFVPDRRPQPDEATNAPIPAPPPPALAIQGVVLAPERHFAVIRHGNPPKLDSISEGAIVDGWTVESIGADRIVLRAGAAKIELEVAKPGHEAVARPDGVPATPARPGNASAHY